MLYYFFALLTAAAILFFNNPRSETNRWAAFFLLCASIGGLSDVLMNAGYGGLSRAVQFINHTLTPYGVLVFSIVYSERMPSAGRRNYLKLALLIPAAVMVVATPFSPELRIPFGLLLIWTAPYYICSCYLLLVSMWNEDNRRKRRNRFVATIIIVPTIVAVLVLINIAKVFVPEFDFFRYISLFIIYSLVAALLCTFVYGVLGVKLRFERDPLESTMKAVSSGTSLLNHSIKNEIGKIAISSHNLQAMQGDSDHEASQHLRIISNASEHMLEMVSRIHNQTKDILLVESSCRLDQLVEQVLNQHKGLLEDGGVDVIASYAVRPLLICDAVHLKEALGNIVMNAIEAMPEGGSLQVRLDNGKKGSIRLSVQDSGKGIPDKQLDHVFDPFFSTKNRSRNFGLGLSYVYNVMQKSGGSVELSSRENIGTLITLHFSSRKVLARREG